MSTMHLTGRGMGHWEERLKKEELAAAATRGIPYRNHPQLVDQLHDRGLLPDPPENYSFLDRTTGRMCGQGRRGAPVVLSKKRAGYAWRDYSQGHNPVAGFNTRWQHHGDSPFYLDRSASASSDAFPAAPRMEGALRAASSSAQLYSRWALARTMLSPVSPETWRSPRSTPSPPRTGRRFYSPSAVRPEPFTFNHL